MPSTRRAGRWVRRHLPDLSGRVVVVTGASSGIGLHTCCHLAAAGAAVVMACRDAGRGGAAAARVAAAATEGGRGAPAPELHLVDLSELESVRDFAAGVLAGHPALDVLGNNAGVMALPRELTVDGFERQLAVNHLAPVLLTSLLLPALAAAPAARVVATTSLFARSARIHLDDLMGEGAYDPWAAYGQSKLADLLFATELARRLEAAGSAVRSLAAHPGYSATGLVANGPGPWSGPVTRLLYAVGAAVVAQPAAAGALPTVAAAALPAAPGATCWGPGGPGQLRGLPRRVSLPPSARRAIGAGVAAALWERSTALTGAAWPW